jgi:hypothetical protein
LDCLILESNRLLWNVNYLLPTYAAWHPRRANTPRRSPYFQKYHSHWIINVEINLNRQRLKMVVQLFDVSWWFWCSHNLQCSHRAVNHNSYKKSSLLAR